jgi:L-malate glycosyltransferase
MIGMAQDRSIRFVPAPAARLHPSPARMRALRDLIRRERPDVIHAWDWSQCIDAYYIGHLLMRVPMVVTDMSMTLQQMLPRSLPTTFGTPELVDQAKAAGRALAHLMLPPVDTVLNAPGAVDGQAFRDQHGIGSGDVCLVTVSRLDSCMKGDSLRRGIESLRVLGRDWPVRLVLVGDGDARMQLERLAAEVNTALGRRAVIFAGSMVDPRCAYAAADIVLGMGSSALRAMAFAKPVVVTGSAGFSETFEPGTSEAFLYRGLYGVGTSDPSSAPLAQQIRSLIERRSELAVLGAFSRQFVLDHFAIDRVAVGLSDICISAANRTPNLGAGVVDGFRTAAVWLKERRFVPIG